MSPGLKMNAFGVLTLLVHFICAMSDGICERTCDGR